MADRGYNNTKLNKSLWNEHQVKPVIGIETGVQSPNKYAFP